MQAYGRKQGIDWLTQSALPLKRPQQQYTAAVAAVLCGADGYHIAEDRVNGSLLVFTLRHPDLAAFAAQNGSKTGFHSHMIAEFAHHHRYTDKRTAYRAAVAAYLQQQGYDVHEAGMRLTAERGGAMLDYLFDGSGRAEDPYAFFNQTAGAAQLSDVKQPLPEMRLYPAADEVFVPQQDWLAEHLLPCFTLDLAALRPEWAGTKIHMLLPCEPEEGLIGEHTEAAHTEFCRTNWLAFRLHPDHRYEFLAAEDYFQAACEPDNASLTEHLREQKQSFAEYRAEWNADPHAADTVLINRLGGAIEEGNWTHNETAPSAFSYDTDARYYDADTPPHQAKELLQQKIDGTDEVRIAYQGRPFHFIASTAGWSWAEHGADDMLLFYEPESRIVLMTFDYT